MDHTRLETLQRCEQETVYRHVRHLTSAEESLAAFFGRVVHEGVRVLYEAETGGSGVERLGGIASDYGVSRAEETLHAQEGVEAAAAACATYWQRELATGLRLPAPGRKPDHRTPALASAIVRLYAAAYPPASRGYSVVLNEQYLEGGGQAEPGASPAECGIVDRVVRRDADGLLYVLDLKTSSWAANTGYWRQWHNSQQAAIYLDLAEAALGERIEGFWCDHIFVSGRKAGPEPGDFVQYGPVSYSEAKRAELRAQRETWRERFVMLQHNAAVPGFEAPQQSTRSCFRFNSACPYLEYCSADPRDREDMVQRDLALGRLVVKPWEPKGRDE